MDSMGEIGSHISRTFKRQEIELKLKLLYVLNILLTQWGSILNMKIMAIIMIHFPVLVGYSNHMLLVKACFS